MPKATEESTPSATPPVDETPVVETDVEEVPEALTELAPPAAPANPYDWGEPDDEDEDILVSDASDADGDAEDEDESDDDAEDAIDDDLLTLAVKAGLSIKEAKDFKTATALQRAIDAMERAGLDDDDEPDAPRRISDKDEFEIELDTEFIDEEVIGGFSQVAEVINDLRRQVKVLNKELQIRDESNEAVQFDNWIAQLGKEYVSELGEGATSDLQPRTKAAKNREAIKDEMATISAGLKVRKKELPSRQELFRRAVKIVIGDKQQKVARERVKSKLRNRQGQFTARPTHRNGTPVSGEAAARQTVRQFFIDRGITPEDDETFE